MKLANFKIQNQTMKNFVVPAIIAGLLNIVFYFIVLYCAMLAHNQQNQK